MGIIFTSIYCEKIFTVTVWRELAMEFRFGLTSTLGLGTVMF